MLFDEEARDRRMRDPHWMLSDLRDARRRALVEHLRAQVTKDEPVTDGDVAKYYAANLREFQSEPRLRIFRILVGTQADCTQVLSEARGAGGLEKWMAFARDHSLDTATRLRGGDLGFVQPDGATDVPQVRADPALYAAAARVRDGDLVQEPITEGSHFACVWRRGSIPAARQSLEQARAVIVQVIERDRLQAALNRLLEGLRRKQVTELHADLLDQVPAPNVPPTPSAGSQKTVTPVASAFPAPSRTDRGLR
jgi:peptidyl-prolyl cis-trans isomerase C